MTLAGEVYLSFSYRAADRHGSTSRRAVRRCLRDRGQVRSHPVMLSARHVGRQIWALRIAADVPNALYSLLSHFSLAHIQNNIDFISTCIVQLLTVKDEDLSVSMLCMTLLDGSLTEKFCYGRGAWQCRCTCSYQIALFP